MAGEKGTAADGKGTGEGEGEEGNHGMTVADLERRILEADADELHGEEDDAGDAGDGGAAEAAREAEREAMSKGWTPKDKFKGDPSKWVDAKTFVERGKRFNQNLQNENASLKKQLAEFKGTADAFRKFHKESMEQRDQQLVKARTDLKKALRIADREENDDLVEEIEGRLALLDQERTKVAEQIKEVQEPKAPEPKQGDALDPILEAWIDEDNGWFRTNQRMMASAIVIGQELKKEHGDNLVGREFLDRVRQEMETEFPEKFKKAEAPAPAPRRSVVDTGSRSVRNSGAGEKTVRDLPPEDRKLCAQFVNEGWVKEKDFIKSYFERNPS